MELPSLNTEIDLVMHFLFANKFYCYLECKIITKGTNKSSKYD